MKARAERFGGLPACLKVGPRMRGTPVISLYVTDHPGSASQLAIKVTRAAYPRALPRAGSENTRSF